MMAEILLKHEVNGGQVLGSSTGGFKMTIPPIAKKYCLAQLDDYSGLSRAQFLHTAPLKFEIEARVSGPMLLGTWGFGLWNDPFSMGFGMGGMKRALPVLPNAAWFFYGSSSNYLSLREDQPASGFHVKIFKSPRFPGLITLFGLPILPMILLRPIARRIRKFARKFVQEDALMVNNSLTEWHL
ncbi:MAG: hypothetical protein ACK2TV_03525, partial [Anaerolineales bacterium]